MRNQLSGATICIDGLIPAVFSGKLVFRPFSPTLISDAYLVWKRGKTPSPAAQALISSLSNQRSASSINCQKDTDSEHPAV